MKKALLLVIGIVAVCCLIANADYLASFVATLQTGALVPLVIAVAVSYTHLTLPTICSV